MQETGVTATPRSAAPWGGGAYVEASELIHQAQLLCLGPQVNLPLSNPPNLRLSESPPFNYSVHEVVIYGVQELVQRPLLVRGDSIDRREEICVLPHLQEKIAQAYPR